MIRHWLWCQVSRFGLWAIDRQMMTAAGRADVAAVVALAREKETMRTYHADHCEALQHARAGVR